MKKRCLCAGLASMLLFFGGCAGQGNTEQTSSEDIPTNTSVAEQKTTVVDSTTESTSPKDNMDYTSQTGYTTAVPQSYKTESEHGGSVERLDYDSIDYARDSSKITKTAYIYTPYGYDENNTEKRYDIIYLMHGWGGHTGEYFDYTGMKNVFDNLIENGDIPPVIIVSGTFYNENSDTDFSGSIDELRQFHRDFEEKLMPAVESKYHTYAQDTTPEGLKAARDHRIFGGFSLGSVTTWLEFCYDYDYIH